MKKRLMTILIASMMSLSLVACSNTQGGEDSSEPSDDITTEEEVDDAETTGEDNEDSFHIGIVTGSFSQSEDDRRGAEAFQKKYPGLVGKDVA